VGFGRVCEPVRCAHPSFWLIATPNGALRAPPPANRSFAAPPKIKKLTISRNKMLPFWSELGRQGRIFFHWAMLHPTELHCILLSYAAPFWVPLHPSELRCNLWATLHPNKLCCIHLSYLRRTQSELSCNYDRMTGWQDDRQDDRQRILDEYMINYVSKTSKFL
jgi:hypothetical protein